MVTEELKKLLIDRFESWELVEFLQLPIEDIVEYFEDEIIENEEDILELLGVISDGEDD